MVVVWSLLAFAVPVGVLGAFVTSRWPVTDLGSARASVRPAERLLRRSPRTLEFVRRRSTPATATGLALTVAALAVLAGGLAVGVLFAMVHQDRGLARLDLTLARWAAENATDFSTVLLQNVTRFGGHEVAIALCLAAIAWEWRRGSGRPVAAYLSVVLIGETLMFNLVKVAVGRARPDLDTLANFAGYSFPSGHATTAASTLAALALVLGRHHRRRTKITLNGLAAAGAAAVAASRVLLGVHWFTDVVAGVALGWAWFALSSIAFGGRLLRFGAPVAAAEHVAQATQNMSTPAETARRH